MGDVLLCLTQGVDMGEGRKGDACLCLGQGVNMGEGRWEMCCCVWDRV